MPSGPIAGDECVRIMAALTSSAVQLMWIAVLAAALIRRSADLPYLEGAGRSRMECAVEDCGRFDGVKDRFVFVADGFLMECAHSR